MAIRASITGALALIAASVAAVPTESIAKAHHYPMAPPLSVVCAPLSGSAQFLCLHPGYVSVIKDMRGLSIPFSSPDCTPKKDSHGDVIVIGGKNSCGIPVI